LVADRPLVEYDEWPERVEWTSATRKRYNECMMNASVVYPPCLVCPEWRGGQQRWREQLAAAWREVDPVGRRNAGANLRLGSNAPEEVVH